MEIGHIEGLFRYPVKSMAGEPLKAADLGWNGVEGDRRLAFRRVDDRSGMPWLTASKLPDLLRYVPLRQQNDQDDVDDDLPTHIRTPDGKVLPVFGKDGGKDLAKELGRRYGAPVELMQLRNGIFDDAAISVIASETIREISQLAGVTPDVRRFRPNILVRLLRPVAFQEETWLGGMLTFGDDEHAPAIAVTMPDVRCSMVNFDPDTASPTPEVLKAVVRANKNHAGIYGTVTRTGILAVGQKIFLSPASEKRETR